MRRKIKKLGKIIVVATAASLFLVACSGSDGGETLNQKEIVEEIGDEKRSGGLVHEKFLELQYAEHFGIDYYEDGYKVITDASDRKILIVPEGKEIPELEEDMVVLQGPIDSVGIYSTVDVSWFRPIDGLDKIKTVTFDIDSWRIPEIIERMEEDKITFIGKNSAIDYELLQSIEPEVNLLSKSGEDDLFPKYDELGLNYISMGAYMEDDPRGRLEWVKFAAALLDKEEEAEKFFEEELARIDEVTKKAAEFIEEKPNVAIVYFSPSKEVFYVNNIRGHKSVTTELAGGQPYPEDLTPEKRGSTAMTDEEFYQMMQDVDILIYDNITGHGVQSMEDLLVSGDYLKDIEVIEEGRVWGLKRDYWQSADKVGDIIEDLYEIFTKPHGEIKENRYHFLME